MEEKKPRWRIRIQDGEKETRWRIRNQDGG